MFRLVFILKAPVPDTYRGKYRDVAVAGVKYANEVKKVIKRAEANGRMVSCLSWY